jgi:predicted MPP superfamily phosphohydrolase
MIYEISWGYKKKGNTQYYVTSGAGTWGPPVRTGSKSEIVNIKIRFEN